jgi:hypothetical protein
VVDPVVVQRLGEGQGHMILADDVGEGVGAVPAIESQTCIHETTLVPGGDKPIRDDEETPRAPDRARLPLLPSGPGGVGQDAATRGAPPSLRDSH